MKPSQKTWWGIVVLILGPYLLFSLAYLDLPGLEFDECIFVNPALGNVDGMSMEYHTSLGGLDIPLMIALYIGAVKSWIYAPIFALFGTSVTTVRLPVVLLGLISLVFTFALVKHMLGRSIALLSLALLAWDPSFTFANRLDWGPVSLMMVFKSMALYLLCRWLTEGGERYLCLSSFFLGVGLFDKLVFIWFIGALVLALPFCFWGAIKDR